MIFIKEYIKKRKMDREYITKNLLIISLIFIPTVEFIISEVNREYLLCGNTTENHNDMDLYKWLITKNIFSIILSLLIFVYFSLHKLNIYRLSLRIIIYSINIMNIIWLIIGVLLLFDENCENYTSSGMMVFFFFNLLFWIFGIYIVNYSVKESLNKNINPLLDEPYIINN
jgi:hypothetical protein